MSNDKTTLAGVQPGGMVRLGDRAEKARFEAFLSRNPLTALCAGTAWEVWQAALAAQPSPGGQGVGVSISDDDRAVLQRLQDALPTAGINGWAKGVEVLERLLRDSLAARQPVGSEPITVEAVATVRRNSDGDRYIEWLTEGGIGDLEVGDALMVSDRPITDEDGSGEVFAAPPAQAVDLGALERVRNTLHEMSKQVPDDWCEPVIELQREVQGLIDSQAMGNG